LTRLIKFVAALLVSSLLVFPAAALGACVMQSRAACLEAPRGPMMMDTQSGSQITSQPLPDDGSCCRLSTPPPAARNSTFTNQSRTWAQTYRLQSAGIAISAAVVNGTAFPETASPPSGSLHQALLCTFLI
jgi:hypothetical protein